MIIIKRYVLVSQNFKIRNREEGNRDSSIELIMMDP